MTPENFAYWLKGFFELTESDSLNINQMTIIKNHLDLVFKKVTPDISPTLDPPGPATTPVFPPNITPYPYPSVPSPGIPGYPGQIICSTGLATGSGEAYGTVPFDSSKDLKDC